MAAFKISRRDGTREMVRQDLRYVRYVGYVRYVRDNEPDTCQLH